jgi:hypothetical protein
MCTGLEPAAVAAITEALAASATAAAPEAALAAGAAEAAPAMTAAYSSLLPGVGAEQAAALAAQTGDFGLMGLGKTMEAAGSAQGLNPLQAMASKGAGGLLGGGMSAGGAAGTKALMGQMGAGLMQPQQPPPMPQGRPPQQAPQEPLPTPYGPGGNSLGLLGKPQMSEEEKRRLRAQGIRV